MPYITTVEKYGYHQAAIDMPRFAADIAKELGGTLVEKQEYPNERQTIHLGNDALHLTANTWKGRVDIYIQARDVPHEDRNMHDKAHRPADASVRPDARPIKHIAADIKRRVVDASQEALRLQREYAAQQAERRNGIAKHAETVRGFPGLDVRHDPRNQRATIYNRSGSHHINATLYADGTVGIERVGSVDLETFREIVDLLNRRKAAS